MRTITNLRRVVLALLLPLVLTDGMGLTACASTQQGASGEVNITVRRIDVLEADYDAMKIAVVLAVENGTGSDVSVDADASVAIVGEAKEQPTDDAEPTEAADGAEAEVVTDGSVDKPVDGARHSGRGKGSASANNTSELPVTIEVPLPADVALLEQLLNWKKMALHVEGNAKVGGKSIRIGGLREVAPPHLPEVKLKEAQVASENDGQSGSGFFTVVLDNKNPFAVTVDKLSFSITIKDKVLQPANGTNEVENDEVPASSVAEYQVEVLMNDAAFGKELKPLLKQPTVPYKIEGTVNVRGITRPFSFAGDMKFPR